MKNIYTLGILLALTLLTAIISRYTDNISFVIPIILGLSAVKFLLVAFQFMELKEAHQFWKYLLVIYLLIFVGITGLLTM